MELLSPRPGSRVIMLNRLFAFGLKAHWHEIRMSYPVSVTLSTSTQPISQSDKGSAEA